MNSAAAAGALALRSIAGFEASDYRWCGERIVWMGGEAVDHPRNFHRPWRPPPHLHDAKRLRQGAQLCIGGLTAPRGLLLWLLGRPLAFPLDRAAGRFYAVRRALESEDLVAFEAAALRVLGVGPGLTPSGDDFLGGIFFALAAAPRLAWRDGLPALRARVLGAAAGATHVISAALLADAMQGLSWRAVHELLEALHRGGAADIAFAATEVLALGSSSGADLLAGLLLALTTSPSATLEAPAPEPDSAAPPSPHACP